jgi:hypothetical protein
MEQRQLEAEERRRPPPSPRGERGLQQQQVNTAATPFPPVCGGLLCVGCCRCCCSLRVLLCTVCVYPLLRCNLYVDG